MSDSPMRRLLVALTGEDGRRYDAKRATLDLVQLARAPDIAAPWRDA